MKRWLKDKFWPIIKFFEDFETYSDYFSKKENWTDDVHFVARSFLLTGSIIGFLIGMLLANIILR
jgi:hypothetical protein